MLEFNLIVGGIIILSFVYLLLIYKISDLLSEFLYDIKIIGSYGQMEAIKTLFVFCFILLYVANFIYLVVYFYERGGISYG